MMPNRANLLWLEADEPGYFWGQCAEFCGESHAVMRFRVIALGPREFDAWLQARRSPPAQSPARRPSSRAAEAQFAAYRTFQQNERGLPAP